MNRHCRGRRVADNCLLIRRTKSCVRGAQGWLSRGRARFSDRAASTANGEVVVVAVAYSVFDTTSRRLDAPVFRMMLAT